MKGTTITVLVLLAIAVGAIAYALVLRPISALGPVGENTAETDSSIALDRTVLADASAIEVVTNAGTVRLDRDPGENEAPAWRVAALAGFPADADRVNELLLGLTDLTVTRATTALPERHADLGLQTPEPTTDVSETADAFGSSAPALIRLLGTDGRATYEIILGNTQLQGQSERQFVRLASDDQTYEVAGRLEAPASATRWIPSPIARVPRTEVARLTIDLPGEEPYAITPAEPGSRDWTIENLPENTTVESPFRLGSAAGAFGFLTADNIRATGAAELNPDSPGDIATATFELTNGGTVRVDLAPPAEDGPLGRRAIVRYAPTSSSTTETEPPANDIEIPGYLADYAIELPVSTYEDLTRPLSELITEAGPAATEPQPVGPIAPTRDP